MVERNGTDGVVKIQVVLEGSVVTLPSHHVIWTELAFTFPNFTHILVENLSSFICTVHSSFLSSNQAVGL